MFLYRINYAIVEGVSIGIIRLMLTNIPLLAGIAGMFCILVGFFLVQSHRLSPDSLRYDVLNFIGSAMLVWYAWDGSSWPFLVLNGVWALYSLKDIVFSDFKKTKMVRKA